MKYVHRMLTRREYEQLVQAVRMASASAATRVDDAGYATEQPEPMVSTDRILGLLALYTEGEKGEGVRDHI